jgi:uncharacterized protein
MSAPPPVRRTDKAMSEESARDMLAQGFSGRLATVGADGAPYCVPLLYLMLDGKLYVHGTSARGHLRANIEHEARVCFEIDEPGEVFAYGRFECDSTIAFRSVVLFGRIRVVEDEATKRRFCDALLENYGSDDWDRPKGFYPRLHLIAVYEIAIERITGKETALPPLSQRWPARDLTKTPDAKP